MNFFSKTMNFDFTLIAIFTLMSIAYGNKAVDEKKKESVRQGKMNYSVPFCVSSLVLTLMSKDRKEMKTKCFR